MRRGAVILLALAGACAIARAQDAAPLANTKQQLQTLQKDRAAEKTKTDASLELRGAVPTLNPLVTDAPAPPAPNLRRDDAEPDARRKAEARKNWLLDGYDRLGRKPGDRARATDPAADEAGEEVELDPKDPDYFLHVYEKQRAANLAKQEEERALAGKTGATARSADAFAPFMQNWLAGSPVRDALKEALIGGESRAASANVRPVNSEALASGRTASGSLNTGAPSHVNGSEASRPATTANPFVQALGLPAISEARAGDLRPSASTPGFAAPAAVPVELTTPERPKIESRMRPPPSPADEKKYFPQLKKF